VRQLENLVERLAILVAGPEITEEEIRIHDPEHLLGPDSLDASAKDAHPQESRIDESFTEFERIEKKAIVDSLEKAGRSVREAAGRLGISQATIYRKIKKYNIDL
jgi:two-component system NtrC family response regulator